MIPCITYFALPPSVLALFLPAGMPFSLLDDAMPDFSPKSCCVARMHVIYGAARVELLPCGLVTVMVPRSFPQSHLVLCTTNTNRGPREHDEDEREHAARWPPHQVRDMHDIREDESKRGVVYFHPVLCISFQVRNYAALTVLIGWPVNIRTSVVCHGMSGTR